MSERKGSPNRVNGCRRKERTSEELRALDKFSSRLHPRPAMGYSRARAERRGGEKSKWRQIARSEAVGRELTVSLVSKQRAAFSSSASL